MQLFQTRQKAFYQPSTFRRQPTMSQRKHPKQIGVNLELAKKERERKSLKIGKERRAIAIQRHRKVMVKFAHKLYRLI